MRETKQRAIVETTCDGCGSVIGDRSQEIDADAYFESAWERDRQLCSVPCLIKHFVANPDEVDKDYHYHLSFPDGDSLRELVELCSRGLSEVEAEKKA